MVYSNNSRVPIRMSSGPFMCKNNDVSMCVWIERILFMLSIICSVVDMHNFVVINLIFCDA